MREKNVENSIILCVKFERHTRFTFSITSLIKTHSYNASFYHNVMKNTMTSLTYQITENCLNFFFKCLKNKNSLNKSKYFRLSRSKAQVRLTNHYLFVICLVLVYSCGHCKLLFTFFYLLLH